MSVGHNVILSLCSVMVCAVVVFQFRFNPPSLFPA